MKYFDVMGSIYSANGLRFGGYTSSQFLNETGELEDKIPGIREDIISDAYYSAIWIDYFPEIIFFITLIFTKSINWAFTAFFCSCCLEYLQFYLVGLMPFTTLLGKIWKYLRYPAFIYLTVMLWTVSRKISITVAIFIIVQLVVPFLRILTTFFMAGTIGHFTYRKLNKDIFMRVREGLALHWTVQMYLFFPRYCGHTEKGKMNNLEVCNGNGKKEV